MLVLKILHVKWLIQNQFRNALCGYVYPLTVYGALHGSLLNTASWEDDI